MYTVYALKSIALNWIYVGMTDNLQRRLRQHQAKQNTSTQYYAPFLLFHKEEWATAAEARIREKYFKTAAGKKRLRKILDAFHGGITGLSNCEDR